MTKIKSRNIFSGLSAAKKREAFQTFARGRGFKIERIVSFGQTTPEGKWLCSKAAEWVAVLRGRASLRFKGIRKSLDLRVGDSLFIPAGTCHRVDRTSPGKKTVWLAVHLKID